jgi:hypothetical protein
MCSAHQVPSIASFQSDDAGLLTAGQARALRGCFVARAHSGLLPAFSMMKVGESIWSGMRAPLPSGPISKTSFYLHA